MFRKNPAIAFRDCPHCLKFQYYEDGEKAHQVMTTFDGQPVLRYKTGNRAPCQIKGQGCDKGTPEHNLNHSPKNAQAYHFHRECKETGDWPRDENGNVDPLVRRHAVIIEDAERDARDEEWARFRISALEILNLSLSMR